MPQCSSSLYALDHHSHIDLKISRVLEVDEGDDGHCWGRFARIRVSEYYSSFKTRGVDLDRAI